MSVIELDPDTNRPQQDPCHCDRFFALSSPLVHFFSQCLLLGSCQEGIQGHLAAFQLWLLGTMCDTVHSVLMAHFQASRSYSHLFGTYLHVTLHVLHGSHSLWFSAFGSPTSQRSGISWRFNFLSVSDASPSSSSQVPCFCPCVLVRGNGPWFGFLSRSHCFRSNAHFIIWSSIILTYYSTVADW